MTAVRRLAVFGPCLIALLCAAPGSSPALAQEAPPAAPPRRLGPGAFATLAGERAAVLYTPGALDRATHVLRRLEVLAYHFNTWSEMPSPIAVYVLGRVEWEEAEVRIPYGLTLAPGAAAILAPALGDDGTVELWRERLGTLPQVSGWPLIGTAEHVATLVIADVLLQVEASRGFVRRSRLVGTEPWIGEVMAHLAATTVFLEHERERMAQIDELFDHFGLRQDAAGGLPLVGYSPLLPIGGSEGLDRWLWYQSRFHRGAQIVVERDGQQAMKRILKMSQDNGGGLRKEELLARYPALVAWLAEFSTSGQK